MINGLLIDCARLLEPRDYYYRLIEFMCQWGMNTLLLHFSDDHGCAIRLPRFREIAMPRAFSPRDIEKLVKFARSHGIDIIPELETFGHTRYITNHPGYEHLFAGRRTRSLRFNAVDPLHPETHGLMKRLVNSVASLFPSPYLHLGCDEVNLDGYCQRKGLDAEKVWAEYVNRMISLAREAGKIPLIWADHVANSNRIAQMLRKDVILVDWRYEDNIKNDVLPRLKKTGFRDFILAPSMACYKHRFLPTEEALENTARMAAFNKQNKAMGLITTVWCPWRYLQNAMYYGIAYSAEAARKGGHPNRQNFHRKFARDVFGTTLDPTLSSILTSWPKLIISRTIAMKISKRKYDFTTPEINTLRKTNRVGREVLGLFRTWTPSQGRDIWQGMQLAAECAWLCSEGMLLRMDSSPHNKRKQEYNRLLHEVRRKMDAEWDRTRFPDDPQKYKIMFPGTSHAYAMILMRRLSRLD